MYSDFFNGKSVALVGPSPHISGKTGKFIDVLMS